jgi:hypothetical protein
MQKELITRSIRDVILGVALMLSIYATAKQREARFQPTGNRSALALDTHTGQLCLTIKDDGIEGVPFCKELK